MKHFGICSLLGISYFRTAFKVHTKSPQDRPKIAQERPKTPQDLQHGANIMPKRGPKRSPRHVRRVSERGFKSDFNLCSHGGAIKNSEGSSENATSFHDGIQDAEITCLLKTMLFQMSWVGGWDCSQVVVSAMLLTPTPPPPHPRPTNLEMANQQLRRFGIRGQSQKLGPM